MLFQPSNIYPSTLSGIGAGTVDVTQGLSVSWQVNGDTPMTAYQVRIYQNDSASTLMYDSGSVSVSPAFETHDKYGNPTFYTFLISAASLSSAGIVNGYVNGYKMLIKQWWSANDYVEQTSASVFITRSQPTISIDAIANPVASSSATITATYAQAQGDPISTVEWVFALAGSESNPIRRTGAINTQILSFDADGLITGNTYSIMCTVVTANGMEASTGFVQFSVSYNSSFISTSYTLSQMKNSSAVYLAMENLGNNILAYPYTDSTKTTNGITFTVNGEGDISASGTASADAKFKIAEGTLSTLGYTAGQKLVIASGNNAAIVEVTETNSSNVVVSTVSGVDPLQYIVPSTSGTLTFYLVVKKGMALSPAVTLSPVICEERQIVSVNDLMVQMTPIQSGSGTPSPDNVRPISGRTGLAVHRTGQNMLSPHLYSGLIYNPTVGTTVTLTDSPVQFTDNGDGTFELTTSATWQYYTMLARIDDESDWWVECSLSSSGNMRTSRGCLDEDFKVLSNFNNSSASQSIDNQITIPSGAAYYFMLFTNGSSATATITVTEPQVIQGLSATTYEPYNGSTYAFDWTSTAGTVYHGTVDPVTGQLTVDWANVDLGSIYWTYESGYTYPYFVGTMPNDCVVGSTVQGQISVLCSIYDSIQNIGASEFRTQDHSFQCCLNSNVSTRRLLVQNSAYTDAATFKTAMNGVQLVYDLETPVTYQITPQEVALLVTNNIWSDSGDVSVSYTKSNGSVAVKSGSIVTITDSKAVDIQVPQFTPTISSVSIYRYLQGENYLRSVCNITDGNYKFLDYYAPSQMPISYLVKAATSSGDLFIQTSQFKPVFWFYSILLCDQDSAGVYHVAKEYVFKYGVESGAVSNSNSPTLQTNFTPYPNRQPISSLYKTGKLTSYIGTVDGQNRYSDTVSLQNAIYDISTSTLTKFLKTRKGDVIMVDTSGAIQMQTEDKTVEQALKATIDWAEVGDSSDISIVSVPQDGFWPLA